MRLHCFGSRGSLASPSNANFCTSKYGGNTTCYLAEVGPFLVGFDQGSGAAAMGKYLAKEHFGKQLIFCLTHYHDDHICGMPFCAPWYIPQFGISVHGHEPAGHEQPKDKSRVQTTVEDILARQQESPFFPVPHHSFPADRNYLSHPRLFVSEFSYLYRHDQKKVWFVEEKLRDKARTMMEAEEVACDWLNVTTIPLNHPDGCLGYRLDYVPHEGERKSLLFATDHEPSRYPWAKLTQYGKGVDLAVFDAHHTEEEIAGREQGFGHGTPNSCIEQANACGIKRVLFTHLSPARDDDAIDAMLEKAREHAKTFGIEVDYARECTVYEV